jgi:hypothetical protein
LNWEVFNDMDKVIVVGTYEFIGFELCLRLLEQGIEVIGIHLESMNEDPFLEEKRLEIGRNSNFTEMDETYLDAFEQSSDPMILFIDYFSYFFKREEKKLSSIMTTDHLKKKSFHFVLSLPIQFCFENSPQEFLLFQPFDKKSVVTIFYLPTIYGPWQPMKYTFQQALNNPKGPIKVDDREWTEDALYIDDVMNMILRNLDGKEKNEYVLKSKIKEHWKQLSNSLVEDCLIEPIRHEEKTFRQEVTVFHVEGTDPQKGIEKQKSHLKRLKEFW